MKIRAKDACKGSVNNPAPKRKTEAPENKMGKRELARNGLLLAGFVVGKLPF
jgi:hypothetical protein